LFLDLRKRQFYGAGTVICHDTSPVLRHSLAPEYAY
jgi:hypothetical protein